jgi:hypothetical protein
LSFFVSPDGGEDVGAPGYAGGNGDEADGPLWYAAGSAGATGAYGDELGGNVDAGWDGGIEYAGCPSGGFGADGGKEDPGSADGMEYAAGSLGANGDDGVDGGNVDDGLDCGIEKAGGSLDGVDGGNAEEGLACGMEYAGGAELGGPDVGYGAAAVGAPGG